MANVQPTGTVTIGVDRLGKHYKYVKGQGAGRQHIDIGGAAAKSLQARGLAPGKPIHLSAGEAQQFGAGGSAKASGRSTRGTPAPGNADVMGRLSNLHAKWIGNGAQNPKTQIAQLLNKGRDKFLEAGPQSQTHNVLAASVLGTILGRGVNVKGAEGEKDSGVKVLFNLGSDTTPGYIKLMQDGQEMHRADFTGIKSLDDKAIKDIRSKFTSLKAQQHLKPVHDLAKKGLEQSGLNAQTRHQYLEAWKKATSNVNEKVAKHLSETIKKISFHDGVASLKSAMDKDRGKAKEGPGAHGAWSYDRQALYLDSKKQNADIRKGSTELYHTHIHELCHAIDQKNAHSGKAQWQRAADDEALDVSDYATTSPQEAFAEFGRLVHTGGHDAKTLAAKYPKMTKYWTEQGLMPEHIVASKTPSELPMKDVMAKPVIGEGFIGDIVKGAEPHPRVIRAADKVADDFKKYNIVAPPEPKPAKAPSVVQKGNQFFVHDASGKAISGPHETFKDAHAARNGEPATKPAAIPEAKPEAPKAPEAKKPVAEAPVAKKPEAKPKAPKKAKHWSNDVAKEIKQVGNLQHVGTSMEIEEYKEAREKHPLIKLIHELDSGSKKAGGISLSSGLKKQVHERMVVKYHRYVDQGVKEETAAKKAVKDEILKYPGFKYHLDKLGDV